MAVESVRRVVLQFTDDNESFSSQTVVQADNDDSPAMNEVKNLSSGNNTITVPAPNTVTGCTIIPPITNTGDDEVTITLKGVNADTGIALHPTDPTSIGLKSTVTSFVLSVSGALTDVRLIWS